MITPDSVTISLSLDWAQKLMKSGYPQKGCAFYWWSIFPNDPNPAELTMEIPEDLLETDHDGLMNIGIDPDTGKSWEHQYLAAPTAEEILRRLPSTALTCPFGIERVLGSDGKLFWQVYYKAVAMRGDVSLANAAAAMYVYLSEHNLLPLSR